jgi:TolB-like protein/AraC-like DNA-binding protein/tetratricopeptide (TPR) repeat protein
MNKEFIQKLTELVEANLANETFGIEDLAREMGMSHSSLHRKLRSATNQNISQFIREVKLKKACELLLSGDLTVAEVAYQVGFGSPTYFNRCFHQYYGCTPGELRNPKQKTETEKQIVAISEKRKRPKITIVFILCASILIPLFFFLINRAYVSKAEPVPDKSIAVLPFIYLGDEVDKQYLADGTMDAILLHLSKIKDLRVISRTSVEQYRNTHKTTQTIGHELDVSYVLEGSFQKNNDRIRLILQLIKTSDDGHVWSGAYDREWKDVFSIQSEVSETIASELNILITPEEKQMMSKAPTSDLTAYDFYQRGNAEFDKYGLDNQNDYIPLGKAQKYFRKALELDSTFALAYVQWAGVIYQWNYWKNFLNENFQDSVFFLANKALSFDNQCAEGYYYRGLTFRENGKSSEALNELDKAIQLNPNAWWAYYLRSFIFEEFFDFVGSISNMNEAALRNRGTRLADILYVLGYKLVDYGFSDLGKKYYRQVYELGGDSAKYLSCLSWAEGSKGNFEKAYQMADSAYKMDSSRVDNLSLYCAMTGRFNEQHSLELKKFDRLKKSGEIDLYGSKSIGYYLWQKGRTKEAKYYFDKQIKIDLESIRLGRWNAIQRGAHFDLAGVYAFLGEKEKAYYYLDEVNKNHSFPIWWINLFKHDPLFNPIRQEPRFQKILKDVEAKYQTEHEQLEKWLVQQKML